MHEGFSHLEQVASRPGGHVCYPRVELKVSGLCDISCHHSEAQSAIQSAAFGTKLENLGLSKNPVLVVTLCDAVFCLPDAIVKAGIAEARSEGLSCVSGPR